MNDFWPRAFALMLEIEKEKDSVSQFKYQSSRVNGDLELKYIYRAGSLYSVVLLASGTPITRIEPDGLQALGMWLKSNSEKLLAEAAQNRGTVSG
jgi:hypothetical protein